MKIQLSPIRSQLSLSMRVDGDIININGDVLDFSNLPDGGEYPPESIHNEFVIGGVRRADGEICITVMSPYINPNAPTSVTFPEPLTITADGPVTLPEQREKEAESAD